MGNHTRTVHRTQVSSFEPNSSPTLRRFQPHEPYWHLRQPIKIAVSTAANHNAADTRQRRDFVEDRLSWSCLLLSQLRCSSPLTLPRPCRRKGLRLRLPRREDELLDATARLEVIWITGSVDVITSLITQVLFWLIPLNIKRRWLMAPLAGGQTNWN